MQKIILSAVINSDLNVDEQTIRKLLEGLGEVQEQSVTYILYGSAYEDGASVWVHFQPDDEEPVLLVSGPDEFAGIELSVELLTLLYTEGVCTGLKGTYPRADRYGTPQWAVDPEHGTAEVLASWNGFKVVKEGFEAHCEDSGDDSCEMYWFKLSVPKESVLAFLKEPSQQVRDQIERLYAEACQRFPTYEVMVRDAFCGAMDDAFDVNDPSTKGTFLYAAQSFGYLTRQELTKAKSEEANEGLCTHGLDYFTCPRGCFG